MASRNVLLPLAVSLLAMAGSPARGTPPDTPGEASETAPAAKSDSDRESSSADAAPEEANQEKFLRVRRDDQGQPLALETCVARYMSSVHRRSSVRVDLIGAVHVADKSYYEELNRLFRKYDALLYELVAPEGAQIPLGGRGAGDGNPVSALQIGMKSLLGLEFQLDYIDYTRPNFVHADMSHTEFAETMKDRGESFAQMFFRLMGRSVAEQSNDPAHASDAQMLLALFSRDRNVRLKRLLAKQFEDMGGELNVFDGPDGSTIITERNRKALEVLAREIERGKRRIGIFYGAGHLPDMERRLLQDFHFQPAGKRWLSAWGLTKPKP